MGDSFDFGETLAVGSGGDQATFEVDCFVIVGQDLYADGWNGAEMMISTNGETVVTFVVDASEATGEFCGNSQVVTTMHLSGNDAGLKGIA